MVSEAFTAIAAFEMDYPWYSVFSRGEGFEVLNKNDLYQIFLIMVLCTLHFIVIFFSGQSRAGSITNVFGVSSKGVSSISCAQSQQILKASGSSQMQLTQNAGGHTCTVNMGTVAYLPVPGRYEIVSRFKASSATVAPKDYTAIATVTNNGQANLDTNTSISDMNLVAATTPNVEMASGFDRGYLCVILKSIDYGTEFAIPNSTNCSGSTPIPPTPPVKPTSCTLNNSSDLSVPLGTVERSEIVTTPGTGTVKNVDIPVTCTGGDVGVNMQLSYTPISVSGQNVVKSSTNGLGVSIIYGSKVLSPTDTTPLSFIEGSNTLNLGFEMVRDPTVTISDVPTGDFTASAIMIMTQQ
ncbi:hypothetical protein M2371_000169 [Buttiauxella sp. BIGb0471]|uniref:fimbrial protein n=1 Tax=Buttiauxella sp. BIGb0471 TaxID=2940597 RepID=UPI0021686FB6|nr:fimbrial protein [Buttiauxella sp. BIGb0471]MCS3600983.1 hypothetical protein [Buttiauxella sp. BIGb0471]